MADLLIALNNKVLYFIAQLNIMHPVKPKFSLMFTTGLLEHYFFLCIVTRTNIYFLSFFQILLWMDRIVQSFSWSEMIYCDV